MLSQSVYQDFLNMEQKGGRKSYTLYKKQSKRLMKLAFMKHLDS